MGRMIGASLLEEMLFLLILAISEVELIVASSCIRGATAAPDSRMLTLFNDFCKD